MQLHGVLLPRANHFNESIKQEFVFDSYTDGHQWNSSKAISSTHTALAHGIDAKEDGRHDASVLIEDNAE